MNNSEEIHKLHKRRLSIRSSPTLQIVSFILRCSTMENNFDQDLIYAIFKTVWSKKAIEREKNVDDEISKGEEGAGTSKKNRPTSANSNAVKLSCEKLRLFVSVHRAATIAEAEGGNKIEATHLERILPQLLLDF
ncbi:protein MHF2 homolog isoform X2 [Lactuca sativa]|uniref:protein MHF2 homolog isoform X2 n=1 Tax=Lactuca sativa TaxID=4236 RepID=UPI000CD92861|nr:protein MHF2 homolog isoform X2 [Lactuca sativa]